MCKIRKFDQIDYATGAIIKSYNSIKEALEEHGIHRATMNHALSHREGKFPERKLRFRYGDGIDKPIVRYGVAKLDYDTGEVIKEYDRVQDAAEENYVSEKTIANAIRVRDGFVKTMGLRFKYIVG